MHPVSVNVWPRSEPDVPTASSPVVPVFPVHEASANTARAAMSVLACFTSVLLLHRVRPAPACSPAGRSPRRDDANPFNYKVFRA
jgi:hypothetical protein